MIKIFDGREVFFQWDLNQKLIVENEAVKEVHFSNSKSTEALVVECYRENGVLLVNVPNILLQEGLDIRAYGYCGNSTKVSAVFIVRERAKPSDYVYTETEVKRWEELAQKVEEDSAWVAAASETFTNALTGVASGALPLALTDVSPIEHNLSIKLENLPEGAKIAVSGKNMFKPEYLTSISGASVEEDGSIKITNPSGAVNKAIKIYLNTNERVTLSYKYKTENDKDTAGLRFMAHFKGFAGADSYIGASAAADMTEVVFDSYIQGQGAKGYELEYIYSECGTAGIDTWIKDIQLEFGVKTDYEPYKEQVLTPENGTVNARSISPASTITCGEVGVTAEVKYNRDINKAFAELQQAILSLGGNV